jgi:phosphoribosylglycinamide formyltransferase-1
MYNLVLFASGNGSNVENIIRYFYSNNEFKIKAVLTNNPQAGVIDRIKVYNIPTIIFTKDEFYQSDKILNYLKTLIHTLSFLLVFYGSFLKKL